MSNFLKSFNNRVCDLISQVRQACISTPRRFMSDKAANVAVTFAIVMTALVPAAGAAVNYGYVTLIHTRLQGAADAAAIGTARELHLAQTDPNRLGSIARSIVDANLEKFGAKVSITLNVEQNPLQVVVKLKQEASLFFMGSMGDGSRTIGASAAARVIGSTSICVLGLEKEAAGAISLEKHARMTGNNCAVYSNSISEMGIKSKDAAVLKATMTCSAGGKVGGKANFDPEPLTDCPVVEDPLADRPAPKFGDCTETGLVIAGESRALYPGVYCGGLIVTKGAYVKLRPGVYVIKDGPLLVEEGARFFGENVGFYMTGKKSTFHFGYATSIGLTAPARGAMAGLLFFEDRNAQVLRKHEIFSDDARLLLGTIYLPQGRLYIDANEPIADQSAYTVIVARKLELSAGPHLILNSDYDQTDIPVPEGIVRNQRVILAR